jgi:hypothetical protein
MSAHAVYDAVLGTGNALQQVESSSFQANIQPIAGTASGAPDPSDYFIGASAPMARFATTDVAGALGFLSATAGLFVSNGTITIPWNQRTNGGTFAGSTSHARLNGTYALIVPVSCSASQDDPMIRLTIDVHFISSDGFTAPVTISTGQSLAAQSFNAIHTFGGVYYGGSQIVESVGWTVNFGIEVEKSSADGGNFPTRVYITNRRPTIDIEFEDLDSVAAVDVLAEAMSSAAVYARKRSAGGIFVADATEQHIKFSFANGITSTESIDANGTSRARAAIRLHGEALTVSAASAIP